MQVNISNMMSVSDLSSEFVRVLDVCPTSAWNEWRYININPLAFTEHAAWVYVICVDDHVAKLGETNLVLLQPGKLKSKPYVKAGGRMGRLIGGDGTDRTIRLALEDHVKAGRVSVHAIRCEIHVSNVDVGGVIRQVESKANQHAEKVLLDHIKDTVGVYPPLNSGRK